jgi:hypothetical protein
MGLFSRKDREPVLIEGRREVCAVGEAQCQDALLRIAGPKGADGAHLAVVAQLRRDPKNAYDANAVGVWVGDQRVGYLPRAEAAEVSPRLAQRGAGACAVRALINGGWDRGEGDSGFFGVVLYMPEMSDL